MEELELAQEAELLRLVDAVVLRTQFLMDARQFGCEIQSRLVALLGIFLQRHCSDVLELLGNFRPQRVDRRRRRKHDLMQQFLQSAGTRFFTTSPSECTNQNVTCFGVKLPGNGQNFVGSVNASTGCLKTELQAEEVNSKIGEVPACDFLIMARLTENGLVEWEFRVNLSFQSNFNASYSPNPNKKLSDGYWVNIERNLRNVTASKFFMVNGTKYNPGDHTSQWQSMGTFINHPYSHFYFVSSSSLFFAMNGDETEYAYTDFILTPNFHKLSVTTLAGGFNETIGPVWFFGERKLTDQTKENSTATGNGGDGNGDGTVGGTGAGGTGSDGDDSDVEGSEGNAEDDDRAIKIALIVFAVMLIILIIVDIILCCLLFNRNKKQADSSREPIQESP